MAARQFKCCTQVTMVILREVYDSLFMTQASTTSYSTWLDFGNWYNCRKIVPRALGSYDVPHGLQ